MVNITSLLSEIDRLATHQVFGKVAAVQGLLVEVSGVQNNLSVGDRCNVVARDGRIVPCEVVGFRNARALVMPFGALEGIGLGCRAELTEAAPSVYPDCRTSSTGSFMRTVTSAYSCTIPPTAPDPIAGWSSIPESRAGTDRR